MIVFLKQIPLLTGGVFISEIQSLISYFLKSLKMLSVYLNKAFFMWKKFIYKWNSLFINGLYLDISIRHSQYIRIRFW